MNKHMKIFADGTVLLQEGTIFDNYIVKKIERINPEDIKLVNFNKEKGTTVIKWKDGTITKVKVQINMGDTYNPEMGMAMCICKKALGNKGNFNEVFKKWLPKGE